MLIIDYVGLLIKPNMQKHWILWIKHFIKTSQREQKRGDKTMSSLFTAIIVQNEMKEKEQKIQKKMV